MHDSSCCSKCQNPSGLGNQIWELIEERDGPYMKLWGAAPVTGKDSPGVAEADLGDGARLPRKGRTGAKILSDQGGSKQSSERGCESDLVRREMAWKVHKSSRLRT